MIVWGKLLKPVASSYVNRCGAVFLTTDCLNPWPAPGLDFPLRSKVRCQIEIGRVRKWNFL